MADGDEQELSEPTERPVRRWWRDLPHGRRLLAAGLAGSVLVLVIVAIAIGVGGDAPDRRTTLAIGDEPAEAVVEPDDRTTTSLTEPPETALPLPTVAPSTTAAAPRPTAPAPPGTRTLITGPDGGWTLRAIDDGRGCVELEAAGHSYGPFLCGAEPAVDVVGDLVTVDTGGSHFVVAVVTEGVTGFSGFPRASGAILNDAGVAGADQKRPGVVYLAGFVARGGHPAVDLLVRGGQDTLARVVVPGELGAFAAGAYEIHTGAPYGRRPGYRYGGMSGLFYGGIQEIGFYDGPDGRTCVLYRRFGPNDRLFLDACPPRMPGRAIPYAVLAPDPAAGPGSTQPVAVLDGPVTSWHCEVAAGSRCTISPYVVADPRGSGRALGIPNTSVQAPGSHREVTFVAYDGQKEVGRFTAPVDGERDGGPSEPGPTTSPTSTTTSTTTTTTVKPGA